MKVSGATTEPFSAIRRRALAQAGAAVSGQPAARADQAAFLGVPEPEMTPAVKAALVTLLTEIDDLRGEVGRLKARLAEAETLADRDALTPLLNRRAFLRELSRVAAFAERYGQRGLF
jgi:GGDEF domain-containing protein